jgi:hypothetical protein
MAASLYPKKGGDRRDRAARPHVGAGAAGPRSRFLLRFDTVFLFLRRGRNSGWLATLLVLAWLAPLVAPHAAGDDLLCEPPPPGEQASLRPTVDDAGQAHHCVICHSARSYRTALSDLGAAPIALTVESAVAFDIADAHRTPALDGLPARAPPA